MWHCYSRLSALVLLLQQVQIMATRSGPSPSICCRHAGSQAKPFPAAIRPASPTHLLPLVAIAPALVAATVDVGRQHLQSGTGKQVNQIAEFWPDAALAAAAGRPTRRVCTQVGSKQAGRHAIRRGRRAPAAGRQRTWFGSAPSSSSRLTASLCSQHTATESGV
jgi:hypothetical protein